MLRVAIDYRSRSEFTLTPTKGVLIDDACKEMLRTVRLGLQRNRKPKITDEFEGSGGVYFLRSANGSNEAVFKPHDEEQGMPANPKDHVGAGKEGLREHFQPGQGCLRELAAYIMDYQNFCRVPATTLVHCEHQAFHYPLPGSQVGKGDPYPKLGSLQRFIHGAELFEDLGQGLLSDVEVQKIALLDMRILNCDRNAANILVKFTQVQEYHNTSMENEDGDDHISFLPSTESDDSISASPHSSPLIARKKISSSGTSSAYELYPIDHGYAMPSRLKIFEWDWAWLYYPQVDRAVAPEIITHIESLNIDDLMQKLEPQVPLSDDSIFLLRLAHYLIVHGVRAGLTLKDIAMTIARSDEEVASKLELSVEEAEENAYRSIELQSSSRVKGSSSMLSQTSSSPKSTVGSSSSSNNSPRSTVAVDVTPVKNQGKEDVPEFPLAISLDLLRRKEVELALGPGTNNNGVRGAGGLASGGDEHTTHETDSSTSSNRSSPTVTCESSHAMDHSPMRPPLSSSSSWNSFTSFNAPQPSLHSYALKSKDHSQDTSLGMSPRGQDEKKSKYLPQSHRDTSSKPVSVSLLAMNNSEGESIPVLSHKNTASMSLSMSAPEDRKLGTIVEYARERGLSSLSNCSTVSHDSDQYMPPDAQPRSQVQPQPQQEQQAQQPCQQGSVSATTLPVLPTILSSESVEEEFGIPSLSLGTKERQEQALDSSLTSHGSEESLGGMYVDLMTSSSSNSDDLKHMSLPPNALRRMQAVDGTHLHMSAGSSVLSANTPTATDSATDTTQDKKPGIWKSSHHFRREQPLDPPALSDRATSDGSESLDGMHVDLGIPLFRSQRSIDSSLEPVLYSRGMNTWAPDLHSPKSSKLTKAALHGNSYSSSGDLAAFLCHSPKHKSSNSLCSSGSGNGIGDDYGDYGFFNSDFNNTTSTSGEDLGPVTAPVNYGEFNGIDLPSTQGDDDEAGQGTFEELCVPVPLTRVVSFSGFESAPVYNNIFAGTMGNLRLERRKAIAKTKEFMQLRLQFAQEHITAIIQRMKREKDAHHAERK
mgnify:CR=1 FL=1